MPADDHHLVAVDLLHAAAVVWNHLAQFRENEIEHLAQAQRAPERLCRRPQSVRMFPSGSFGFEQACALDRGRRLCCEGCCELRELLVVEVGLELVEGEDADDAVPEDERCTDPAANASAAVDLTRKMWVLGDIAEDVLAAGPQNLDARIAFILQVEADPEDGLEVVEAAPTDDDQAIVLDHLHRGAVVGHDVLELRKDRLERVLLLFVALVFGELASHYPVAGALYQYSKFSVGPKYGWLVGWFYGVALLITVAAVDTGVVSYVTALTNNWFGWNLDPTNHWTILIITIILLAIQTTLNITGAKVMGRVAQFGVYVEILGTFGIALILAIAGFHHGLGFLFTTQGVQHAATNPLGLDFGGNWLHRRRPDRRAGARLHLLRLRVGR